MTSISDSERPRIHDALGYILTRPEMYVGQSDNLLESLWSFISGFDCGIRYLSTGDQITELIPKELFRYIQQELGLQFNDFGIVPRLIEQRGSKEDALIGLREMVGQFYGCEISIENFPPKNWTPEHSDDQKEMPPNNTE
ncbi:MAG: hypothetical protein CMO55_00820 [Verrucomicrobiales bacterium]|nr:hypothetical protein [Verrucomicrobiales bacterium]